MSIAQSVSSTVSQQPLGEPFAVSQFLKLGSRSAVDKALSRLTKQGTIERIAQGVYMRPKKNRFVGTVKPEASKVVQTIAEANGETLQIHGAEAARRFQLSTQVPTQPVYYTSGSSRSVTIGKLKVKLLHVTQRKLQLAGKKSGLALSALWYLGKEGIQHGAIEQVCSRLSSEELRELLSANLPAWLSSALHQYSAEKALA